MRDNSALIRVLLTVALFVVLEVLSILMIAKNGVLQRYGIMGAIRNTQSLVWETTSNVRSYFGLREEIDRLNAENASLRGEISRLQRMTSENDSIINDISPLYSYLPAKIIKNSVNKQHNFIVLDKGSRSGVVKGMGVVTGNGVVGIVNDVTENYAQVISFLSGGQNISAKIKKNDMFGPMVWKGTLSNSAKLREIPIHADVAKGDTVVTSGFSTIFPPDIPIGIIKSIAVLDGSSKEMTVQMFQDFCSLKNVFIVINNDRQELSEFSEQGDDKQ